MLLKCRFCGEVSTRVGKVPSRSWDGVEVGPNDAGYMCPECTEEYCAYWPMWD